MAKIGEKIAPGIIIPADDPIMLPEETPAPTTPAPVKEPVPA